MPLLVNESATRTVRSLLADDPEIVVWWGTVVECMSALTRIGRESTHNIAPSVTVLRELSESFLEVRPTAPVREDAIRLLGLHSLRAADALQLSAALAWRSNSPDGAELVALDDRLRRAATSHGFSVVP